MPSLEMLREIIFNEYLNSAFDESIKPVLLDDASSTVSEEKDKKAEWPLDKNASNSCCSYCRVTFPNVQHQREHYKLDWHRYNLKQSLQSKGPVEEEEFNKKTENDDISSISGSDTEEEDTLDSYVMAQGKIFLQNKHGEVFSLYRTVLLEKKEEPASVNLFQRFQKSCIQNKKWAILMLGGGHFAGAIFDNMTPLTHKTFHCYTVRAGQGGAQSSRDNKSASSQPKSAGASLRRYNEQALVQHVRDIVTGWSEEIQRCSVIFYRASGPYNKSVLFGGKEPLLIRGDSRLRTIPFSTGRATYKEVVRVHNELTSVVIYKSLTEATHVFSKQKSPERDSKRNKAKSSSINRAKSREAIQRPLPGEFVENNLTENEFQKNYIRLGSEYLDEINNEEMQLEGEDLEVSFDDLQEYGDSLTPAQRQKGRHSKKKPKKSKAQKLKEKEQARKKHLVDVLVKGNVTVLKGLFEEHRKKFKDSPDLIISDVIEEFFNEILDEDGNSFLHLTAMNEHEEMLQYLLQNEANPCLKNKNQQTPYSCTKSKGIRDIFRQFAKDNPDKYNYNKAHIPLNVLAEEELAEKKKAQRKVKKEKEKEKRKENQVKQKEEDEKSRFLKLSDREKRALAAERRILNAEGKVIARCFLCASDMAGKVPFEYLENRFCSIECLKSHRLKSTTNC